MRPSACWLLVILLSLTTSACQPAKRYPAVAGKEKEADELPPGPMPSGHDSFQPTRARPDIPLVFISADKHPEEWKKLPAIWNQSSAAKYVAPVGLDPLNACIALSAVLNTDKILIKVPLGLPDPTPYIPPSNPPTLARWRLGQKLFFDKDLLPVRRKTDVKPVLEQQQSPVAFTENQSCVQCHNPEEGFTTRKHVPGVRVNPLSLHNVVYNKHQFWDGRADYLEEVIQRDLADERFPGSKELPADQRPEARHVWGGVVQLLQQRPEYEQPFLEAFGTSPTQDTFAKALATYLRTILTGDSLFDRAEQIRQQEKAATLTNDHLAAVLDEAGLKRLKVEKSSPRIAGREIAQGYELFQGKAGCASCHSGPLFTDQQFHNTGLDFDRLLRDFRPGRETGRLAGLPPGLKDNKYIGAYRTPTLRALPRTAPYFRPLDETQDSLTEVLKYYNTRIQARDGVHLDPLLRGPDGKVRQLRLDDNEIYLIELFLRSLDGEPVADIVARPDRKKGS